MEFCSFHEVLPDIASTETRSIIFFIESPGDPPPGKYHFIEMFCTDPQCDCHNSIIAIYREHDGKFQEVTKLRFCWKDNAFYKSIGLDFFHDELPGVFPDFHKYSTQFDDFFVKQFISMCYIDFDKYPSLRHESDYAKRIQRHYNLFKEYMVEKTMGRMGPKISRNEACPCGSGTKYKKYCKS